MGDVNTDLLDYFKKVKKLSHYIKQLFVQARSKEMARGAVALSTNLERAQVTEIQRRVFQSNAKSLSYCKLVT